MLSAVLGFFVDWDDSFSYDSAEGIAYTVCISLSTCLLASGVVHAAIFRGQTLYTTRDVDVFVFFVKCVADGTWWPDTPLNLSLIHI